MIKSMTGFAAIERDDGRVSLAVTVRSVNHRYLDVQMRLPPAFAEIESALRALVQRRVARGRVELTLTARLKVEAPVEIALNETVAAALAAAGERARLRGWTESGLTAGDLLRFPQAVTVREMPVDEQERQALRACVSEAVGEAIEALDGMRRREGEALHADVVERAAQIGDLVGRLAAASDVGDAALRARLAARIEEIGEIAGADPTVVAQEIVKWVARSDVHEEVARLRGHLEHLTGLAAASGPCGRKLDFLAQEMNREVNTIGSKAEGREAGALVVAAKAELEKLREQIQNVE